MRAAEIEVRRQLAKAFAPVSRGRIGIELEWLVYRAHEPSRPVSAADVLAAVAGLVLPCRGVLSVEPGGQLELSSAPTTDPEALLLAVERDLHVLRHRMEQHGLTLVTLGLDPLRLPVRTLPGERYDRMEAHFGRHSPDGVVMMCSTASTQINVDFGEDAVRSWAQANALGPVLSALFANSPQNRSGIRSLASQRQRTWYHTDPARTSMPTGSTVAAWQDYALDAGVLSDVPRTRSLRALVDQVTTATVDEHVTCLFPPVRPRGFLELRCVDALPDSARRVAVALVWALLQDGPAGECAARACRRVGATWAASLGGGLGDERITAAADACLLAALPVLKARAPSLVRDCEEYLADLSGGALLARGHSRSLLPATELVAQSQQA